MLTNKKIIIINDDLKKIPKNHSKLKTNEEILKYLSIILSGRKETNLIKRRTKTEKLI